MKNTYKVEGVTVPASHKKIGKEKPNVWTSSENLEIMKHMHNNLWGARNDPEKPRVQYARNPKMNPDYPNDSNTENRYNEY